MDCNNKYCYWQILNQCCPESEELFDNAIPDTLDCPSSLRYDFKESLYKLIEECNILLLHRNMKQLMEIKKFIENQQIIDKI